MHGILTLILFRKNYRPQLSRLVFPFSLYGNEVGQYSGVGRQKHGGLFNLMNKAISW